MRLLKIIPDVVRDPTLCSLPEMAAVDEAARRMTDSDVSAVVVVDENGKLCGIVTERDITRRVVALAREPSQVRLAEVMTRNPDTLAPNDLALDALELMQVRKYRHLPIVDGGRVIGVVSIRDLCEVAAMELDDDMRETQAFVFGDRHGA